MLRDMGRRARDLEASVVVAASPARVWAVVSDLRRTPQWSPECRRVLVRGDVAEGSLLVGVNRRGPVVWFTRSRVHLLEPGRALGWTVRESGARWSYRLHPREDGGTLLVHARTVPDGVPVVADVFARLLLGGQDAHGDELEDGMRVGLERIRALVEG
jgi:uncharacterized protein YndB with AHSA1/START domain